MHVESASVAGRLLKGGFDTGKVQAQQMEIIFLLEERQRSAPQKRTASKLACAAAPGIKRAEQIKTAVRSPEAIRCASDEGLFRLEAEERGEGVRNEVLGLKLKTCAGC